MKLTKLTMAAALCVPFFAFAEVSVTTGAGYMNMAKELSAAYAKQSGVKVTENYGGNIGQMLAQIASGNGANVVISDLGTLKNIKSPVKFAEIEHLGTTPLVFVWRKGSEVKSVKDLTTDKVKSFAYPDPKAAVYGRAAKAYLNGLADKAKLDGKSMSIASVPQVMAYVSKGEIDAGFVNRTAAKNNQAKIGGSEEIQSGYPKIEMVAAVVEGNQNDKDVKGFLKFLDSKEAKVILEKHGIK